MQAIAPPYRSPYRQRLEEMGVGAVTTFPLRDYWRINSARQSVRGKTYALRKEGSRVRVYRIG